jgi:hypothetical protein
MSGGRRSEVKEEGRAQPGPGDMSGVGHPASLARTNANHERPQQADTGRSIPSRDRGLRSHAALATDERLRKPSPSQRAAEAAAAYRALDANPEMPPQVRMAAQRRLARLSC